MKRIGETQEEVFDKERSEEYLKTVKNESMTRFMNFVSVLKRLDIKGKYLDVGCGPGVLTQKIAENHPEAEVTGLDISPDMIRLAEEDLSEELRPRVNYILGDACNMKSISNLGKFDLIFSTFTMHHWSDTEAAIHNLYKIVKPGAYLYIYDLKRVPWLYYLRSKGGFFQSIRASFRPKELREIMQKLKIESYQIKTVFPFFMQSILIRKEQ